MNKHQKDILTKLISSNTPLVKYSDIQLKNIDNDKYNYHLQQLVKTGYVNKNTSNQYSLTTKGTQHIAQLDAQGYQRETFRVSVITLTTRDTETGLEILIQKRKREPYIGDITSISGKVLPAEKVEDTASRKLNEEAGLKAKFTLKGIFRKIRLDTDGDLLEDIFFNICHSHNPIGELIQENIFGENYWGNIDDLIKATKGNKGDGPESIKIYQYLKEDREDFFHIQEVSTIEEY